MQAAETFEPEQQAAEFVLPPKHTLNGVEPLLEDRLVEDWFAAAFGEFPAPGIRVDVWHHAAVEDRLPVTRAIVNAVQADNRFLKVNADGAGHSRHVWQGRAKQWRFVTIAGSGDKRRDDIAVPITKSDDVITLDLLVSVESDVVTALLRGRGRAIAVNDGHAEKSGLMELQYHDREDDIKTAVGLPPSKHAINTGVMNLRVSVRVFFDRQFLPLTSNAQQFQDVIEQGMQRRLRRRAPASNGQVGQDKLLELLEAQFRRNAPRLHTLRHFDPQKKREPVSNQATAPKSHDSRSLPVNPNW